MAIMQRTLENKKRRQNRVRAKVAGTSLRPRLAVFRSNKHIYAQIIDDTKGETLLTASDKDIKTSGKKTLAQTAQLVGVEVAKKAQAKKITDVVFDRGGFKYMGAVAALAEGAREGGLNF
jgi:large subunit ribosomal protein L18